MGSGYGVRTPVQDALYSPHSPVQDAVQGRGHRPGQRVRTSVSRGHALGRGGSCVCAPNLFPPKKISHFLGMLLCLRC